LNGIREIIDIEKKPWGLDEEKNVVALAKVQDLELSQNSIVANFFDYGNVTITTAGAGTPIVFRHVPKPEDVRREISRRMEQAKNIAEDMGDDLTLQYFAHYSKIFSEQQKNLQEQLLDEVRKMMREERPR
jgi:exonuclease III